MGVQAGISAGALPGLFGEPPSAFDRSPVIYTKLRGLSTEMTFLFSVILRIFFDLSSLNQ